MERLTKKIKKPVGDLKFCVATNPSDAVSITQKLGRLEDLEEQIGMPLEDLYKCVTHNGDSFYIIEKNDDSEELEVIEVFKEDGYMYHFIQGTFYFTGESEKGIYYEYPIMCYGKDLFLNREEAEKKLEEMKNEIDSVRINNWDISSDT